MNLKNFKNVTTKPSNIEFDKNYLEKLSRLPKSAPKRHTLEIISTIAAAIVIVTAVSLWALIGRGVRGESVSVVAGSYAEIPVTNELNAKLNTDLFGKYDVFCFREFDNKNPLSVHEILQINRYAENGIKTALYDRATGEEINEYAKAMFGFSPADKNAIYGCEVELGNVDFAGAAVGKISTEDLSDGTKKIRIEYTDFYSCVLEYVGYDLFSPIRFTAFYKEDTELSKDYADVKIYKVLCDELEADQNIESYLLYIAEAPSKTEDGYCAKVMLDYSFADGKPHSILGSIEEYKDKQTAELILFFKTTKDGLQLIKENGENNSFTLTDVTKWHEEFIHLSPEEYEKTKIPEKSIAKTIEYEFLGTKYTLKLKEAIHQQRSWKLYKYTNGDGTSFLFTKNGELVEYGFNKDEPFSDVYKVIITKEESKQIAIDFARQMFGEQFDDYSLDGEVSEIGPSGPTEKYSMIFSKKYGKDGKLKGESCYVEIDIHGRVLQCSIRELYEFKKHDMSFFDDISQADIEKKVLAGITHIPGSVYTVENANIQFIGGKTIISAMVLETAKDGCSAGFSRYYEVTK